MYKKGREYALEDVIKRFLEFAQLKDDNTQAWELLDTRLSTFYGATLRVPMKYYEKKVTNYKYLIIGDSHLSMQKMKDYITSNFDSPIFNEYYTYSYLPNVISNIQSIIQSNLPDMIIFNCCEDTIISGESARFVYDRIFEVVKICEENNIEFRLFITPIRNIFTSADKKEKYNKLRRSSIISKKPVIDCFGDSMVSSWTDSLQSKFLNTSVINKGIDWDTTQSLLDRFNDDVVQELPDICFIWAGIDDFFGNVPKTTSSLADTEKNFSDLIGYCEKHGITPMIGFYQPTDTQLNLTKSNNPSQFTKTVAEVNNLVTQYRTYCNTLAKDRNIKFVDFTPILRLSDGSFDPSCFSADGRTLTADGETKVADEVESKIWELIQLKESLSYKYKVINIYNMLCDYFGVSELDDSYFGDESKYSDEIQEYVVNNLRNTKDVDPIRCPYFYISFQHTVVKNNTYRKWLYTGWSIPEYVVKNQIDEYSKRKISHFYMSEAFNHYSGNTGKGTSNLFTNEGEFVAVGLHTTFDFNLWMCEQGGITCQEEATKEANDLGFLPPRENRNPTKACDKTPVFPGTGCPWFTVSEENKEDYDIEDKGIEYWFTKNDYDATITIRFTNAYGKDVYQSMSFGRMTTTDDDSYMFPLFVAGGNQGLSFQIDQWKKPNAEHPTSVDGVMYDLAIKNATLSNSNLLFPTSLNSNNSSNFRIMSPDGDWVSIISMKQSINKLPQSICPRYTQDVLGVALKEPEFIGGEEFNTSLPYPSDSRNLIDTYTVNEKFSIGKSSAMINNVVIFLNRSVNHEESGIMGTLPNSFFYGSRSSISGEVVINNKRYLSIPNGWDDRLVYYPFGICEFVSNPIMWMHSDKISEFYDNLFDSLMTNKFTHKLLIYLEDV